MNKTTTPERTAQEIVRLVEERLAPYQPADHTLDVLPDVTHKEGRWWYVIVSSQRSSLNPAEYNARVEKVERDLKKLDNAHVVLLPDVPDWMNRAS
ncbi:MAG: hypothetical protein JO250_17040 [Armatimonadetes bacterium]|nr:hypothetical protein [Armatimonadota bacterium]